MRKNKRYMKMYSIMLATTLAVGLSACGKSDTATNDSVSVAEADMEAGQENESASAEDAEEVAVEESEKEESSKISESESDDDCSEEQKILCEICKKEAYKYNCPKCKIHHCPILKIHHIGPIDFHKEMNLKM